MRGAAFLDLVCAWLVALVGVLHLAVGRAVFVAPTTGRIWFASAGFLLIVTGLANVAAHGKADRAQNGAGLAGSLAILVLGGLIARSDPGLLWQPQTLLLLALGAFLTVQRLRMLTRGRRRRRR
jgi:uncharacterized membrane protein HdeD (DUF308 family)